MVVGWCLPGLSCGNVEEPHPSHSGVAPFSQAIWMTGEYYHLRNVAEVLEEENLQ